MPYIDHEFDADDWFAELEDNKTYEIAVDLTLIDPYLIVDVPGGETEQVDDDSWGAIGFGSSTVLYRSF